MAEPPVLLGRTAAVPAALVRPLSAARWLLVLVLAAAVYFFHGFLVPVLAALVIGFASWPLLRRLRSVLGGRRTLAAAVALLIIIAFLVIPLSLAVSYAVQEVRLWFSWALEVNRHGEPAPSWIVDLPLAGEWLSQRWNETLGQPGALGEVVQFVSGENIGNIYRIALAAGSGAFNFLLGLLFLLIALFFVYRDGDSFAAQIDRLGERILPLQWRSFSRVVPETISATVTGMGLIAIGEGVVLGVAYWIAGVPSPVTLGVLTGIMALVPGGAPLAFTCVSLYLVGSGATLAGIGLFTWGAVELFIVDKTLRPRLVGGPIKLPFLPTFFGLVGGVKTMGLLGLFIGPVLMALIVAIWREWMRELKVTEPLVEQPAPLDLRQTL
ncbi:AI-2E family transporter [Mangrovicella endophytica]|uniref:AI-2E family transporter n=1 Tax=Mangrovicella endophytica TaxID=2066697 RepID=UPI000C9E2E1D|nr:AI-2E family transporter [Mangrovicella endophytica]